MKNLTVYTFSQWNEIILDIKSYEKLIHQLKSEDKIGLTDSAGELKLYAKLDEVGSVKYVHKELVD